MPGIRKQKLGEIVESQTPGVPKAVWLALAFGFPLALGILSVATQWHTSAAVSLTLQVSAVTLALWLAGLVFWQNTKGIKSHATFKAIPSHYGQAIVHTSILLYWGWYWRPVYDHLWLIVAQLLLAYSLDMLLSLSRRRHWGHRLWALPHHSQHQPVSAVQA